MNTMEIRRNFFNKRNYTPETFGCSKSDFAKKERILNDLLTIAALEIPQWFGAVSSHPNIRDLEKAFNEYYIHIANYVSEDMAERFLVFLKVCLYNIIDDFKKYEGIEKMKEDAIDTINGLFFFYE